MQQLVHTNPMSDWICSISQISKNHYPKHKKFKIINASPNLLKIQIHKFIECYQNEKSPNANHDLIQNPKTQIHKTLIYQR